ncbi:MAG TPA: pitrilysin family protein, partial [Tepidiformaceae bacterium]|nr:pitrilysin family protein [Tepidiformaceae bacterium]
CTAEERYPILITPGPRDIIPFPAEQVTLPNGLRVIAVNTGFPNLVSLQIPVQTGSRNEVEPGKSGFAHFFEHMMFRGTERLSTEAYQDIVTRSGARQNAYTTDDYTNYHMTFAAEDLETILDIEADRFMNLRYSEADFKTEARAVLGEYNKSAADPLTKLLEVQRDHAYTTHTYKHTTMGFIADIDSVTSIGTEESGDIDPAATVALVERYWGGWKGGGSAAVEIPQEPPQAALVVVHHPWNTPTLPWVSVGFHGPAFSTTAKDYAALDVLLDLHFGETSDLYRRLVEKEQVVDQLFPYLPSQQDPGLATVFARVKRFEESVYVRDAIAETFAKARVTPVTPKRLEEAKSHNRYAFARTLDNSESIAATLARFVRFERSYTTLNELFETYDALEVADLDAAAGRYLTNSNMVVAALSHEEPGDALLSAPSLDRLAATPTGPSPKLIEVASPSSLIRFKLMFGAGSAHDPVGKEGLAALAAAMITEAGSKDMAIDEITRALFPLAASFSPQVDREVTVFTGVAHADVLDEFLAIALPQLVTPGFREDDFERLREQQINELLQDLRSNNEEELGKERLQQLLFQESAYGHPVLGSLAALEAVTLDDVREFVAGHYTRANLTVGVTGAIPGTARSALDAALARMPVGEPPPPIAVSVTSPAGLTVEIVEKETRSVAVSFGHPIEVRRGHPDFVALWLARAWLGEHRASNGRLYQRIREVRGMNYGNYAYIEAFPRGMYQFFPDANLVRQRQIFEIWLRPLRPEQAVFGLKLALYELRKLIQEGISDEDFASTREYLEKNVLVMTKTQDQQLGYALDSDWYGTPEFTAYIRSELSKLTAERVNDVVRRHLSWTNLQVVMIAADAQRLKAELLSNEPSTITYDGEKPGALLAEDRVVGNYELGLTPDRIVITPVEQVFA